MHVVMLESADREEVIADFAEAVRTCAVPDRAFVLLLSYKVDPDVVANIAAAVAACMPDGEA